MSALALPHTWRPRKTRIFCYVIAGGLLVVLAIVAMILPHDGARAWNLPSRIGVFAVGIPMAAFLHRHGDVRIIASDSGLEVVNLFRRHHLKWGEVLAVRLRRGDPWAFLDLSNGETIPAMGIQNSDGDAAPRAARELASLVREKSG
ncbi:PH domain-containing protein [Sporichthya sp.]|uniref:PH domain-containing protein n=1 Tax=Sporichthya sp. TaxID=65475 RepID=UPI0018217D04|nr:PH domain-containing protein [Sporichthya sp.]MBA3744448.1 PH domain-containing protein [Sporichthya sp.]